MKGSTKLVLIAAGYAGALIAAFAAVHVRQILTQGPEAQASSGMYAFGDVLLFIGVFAGLSMGPTAAALYFLRPFGKFWTAASITALVLSGSSWVMVIMNALNCIPLINKSLRTPFEVLGLMSVGASPFPAAAFFICALPAPERLNQRLLLTAAGIEAALAAYVFVKFVLSRRLF